MTKRILPNRPGESRNVSETESGSGNEGILKQLLDSQKRITENKNKAIVFSKPLLLQNGNGVIYPRTINIIQGKSGVHKSRLVEGMCACLLNKYPNADNHLGLEALQSERPVVCYIDTERNLSEQFPYAIQQIHINAGYRIDESPEGFEYTSLLDFNRDKRLEALIVYIKDLSRRYNKNIVVILDVVSDCLLNFNDSTESMRLIDFMNQTINNFDVTFICVIHENPGSMDKARGHLGTELNNKASTVIQIGFEKDKSNSNTDLIRMSYLKCRSTKRHEPVYFRYSDENKRLELASPEDIKEASDNRQQKAPLDNLIELLPLILLSPTDKADLFSQLKSEFKCSDRLIENRLSQILDEKLPILDRMKNKCYLVKEKIGKNLKYFLTQSSYV